MSERAEEVWSVEEIAQRYRKVAGEFTARAESVPDGAWDNPSPCEGWVARDVVRHLVEWTPPFLLNGAGAELPQGPPVDDDPVAAWEILNRGIQALLDDPETSRREFHNEHTGRHPLDQAIAMFILGDVLVHTWDLARATGLDETLDAEEVHVMLVGIEPLGDVLSQSGHYGHRVDVPDDADEQTRLLACTGRRPWARRSAGCHWDTGSMSAADDDLADLSHDDLVREVIRLRQGIRRHRDSTGQDLCWHHPQLWGLLPESTDPLPEVPAWPQFLRGCVSYRQSLDDQLSGAPRIQDEYDR